MNQGSDSIRLSEPGFMGLTDYHDLYGGNVVECYSSRWKLAYQISNPLILKSYESRFRQYHGNSQIL